MVANDEDGARSRLPRDSMFLSCTLDVTGARKPVTVRVRNLSPGGMMVDGDLAFFEGARVRTDLRGIGEVEGRVVWATEERAGIAFDWQVDPKLARNPVGIRRERPLHGAAYVEPTRRPGLKLR